MIPPNILAIPENEFRLVLSQATNDEIWRLYADYPPNTRHVRDSGDERRFSILGECARRGFWDSLPEWVSGPVHAAEIDAP